MAGDDDDGTPSLEVVACLSDIIARHLADSLHLRHASHSVPPSIRMSPTAFLFGVVATRFALLTALIPPLRCISARIAPVLCKPLEVGVRYEDDGLRLQGSHAVVLRLLCGAGAHRRDIPGSDPTGGGLGQRLSQWRESGESDSEDRLP